VRSETSGVVAAAAMGLIDVLLDVAARADTWLPPHPAPRTSLGRWLEGLLIALRYALVVVPISIVAAEVRRAMDRRRAVPPPGGCPSCGTPDHQPDAAFCVRCGGRLPGTADADAP
jgi:hypothetical protein